MMRIKQQWHFSGILDSMASGGCYCLRWVLAHAFGCLFTVVQYLSHLKVQSCTLS